jgi:hypothetical protein
MDRKNSNLAYLMSVFNVTSNELAQRISVHFSLVSKWKNNKLNLSSKSENTKRIIDYFIELDRRTKYTRLKGILGDAFRDVSFDREEVIAEYLEMWLTRQYQEDAVLHMNLDDVEGHVLLDMYRGHKAKAAVWPAFLTTPTHCLPVKISTFGSISVCIRSWTEGIHPRGPTRSTRSLWSATAQ